MKLAFLLLILLNLALYAWQQGAFGRLAESGREPERISLQIEPERIRALSEKEVAVLRDRANTAAPRASAPAAESATQACVEFGDFSGAEVARAEAALSRLGLGARQSARIVEVPGWYQVLMPPFKTRAEADRRADALRKLGVRDVLVIGEGPLRFGLGLGSFSTQDAARAHAAALETQGVKGVRISEQQSTISVTRFQLREVDAALNQQFATIQKDFPAQSIRPCPAS
jgi:hypothetical protein